MSFITLFIALLSVVVSVSATLSDYSIYHRELILDGQYWRLLTGHLVHQSLEHLIFNLAGFIVSGSMIENKMNQKILYIYSSMAVSISVLLIFFESDLLLFGGLSGITYGLVFYLVLTEFKSINRQLFMFVILGKLTLDYLYPDSELLSFHRAELIPVALSHIGGVLVSALIYLMFDRQTK